MLKKLVYIFLIFSTLLYASDTTDTCVKNFDDEIQKQRDIQTKLQELQSFCSSKQQDIKDAYKSVDEFSTKIRNITRNNLIKSTLKLGWETYKEISPLSGIEGKLTEISGWLADKAKDYVVNQAKQTLGIAPKDYYNQHIDLLSKDLSKITPDVLLLTQMQQAGLEAFKIKVQREQNQTVGDVGALYAKLRSLSEQSEKAKRSLYAFYRELNLVATNTQAEMKQIDTIIASYQRQKTRTCADQPLPEIEPEDFGDDITFTPYTISIPTANEKDCTDAPIGYINDLNKTISKLIESLDGNFTSDLTSLTKAIYDDQNATLQQTYIDINIDGFLQSFPENCSLLNEKISITEAKSITNYNEAVTLWDTYIKHLQDMKPQFDDFVSSTVLKYPQIEQIKQKSIEMSVLLTEYGGRCEGVSGYAPDVNSIVQSMIDRVKYAKQAFVDGITKTKEDGRGYQIWVDNIAQNVQDAQACVSRDANDLSIIMPQVQEVLNYFDEQDMAIANLIDYMRNLEAIGMVTKSSSYEAGIKTTYLGYSVNDAYFKDMYSNFKGTDLEFIQKVQDILRPIGEDITKLNSIIESKKSLIDSTYAEVYNNAAGFLARPSYPLVNISSAQNLKDLLDIAHDKRMEHTYISENVSAFATKMAGGEIPYIPYYSFVDLIQSMQKKQGQLREQLRMADMTISAYPDFKNYKECINSLENFEYELQNVVTLSSLALTSSQEMIDGNKTKLKETASESLPQTTALLYDLYTNPSTCKASLMNLEIQEKSISIAGVSSYVLEVNASSCDDRNISLSVDLNESLDSIHINATNQKVTITSDGVDKKDLILVLKLRDVNHGNFITKQIPLHVVTSVKTVALKKGWNLVSGGFDALHVNKDISIVWSFQNGTWHANSPYENIRNLIEKVSLIKNIKDLYYPKQQDGVWVYALSDTSLDVDALESSENLVVDRIGWSLAGSSIDIDSLFNLTCKDAVLDAIWEYKDDTVGWKVYIKDVVDEIQQIKANEGFWVHCKN
jgi:hypothetical protein